MPCQTPPHAAPAASPRCSPGLQALALAGFAVYYVVELVLGEGSDATRVLMSALLILVGGRRARRPGPGLARCRGMAAHPDHRLERDPPAGRHQPDPGQPGGASAGSSSWWRSWASARPGSPATPRPRCSRGATCPTEPLGQQHLDLGGRRRGRRRRHAPGSRGMPSGSVADSRPRSAVVGFSTRPHPSRATSTSRPLNLVASAVDGCRDDDQPVVAVDEAGDLAQHRQRGRCRPAGRRRRRTAPGRGGARRSRTRALRVARAR